jgi:hypothetical protein
MGKSRPENLLKCSLNNLLESYSLIFLRAIFFSIQYNRDININYYNLNHKYKCMAVIGIKEQQANGNYY